MAENNEYKTLASYGEDEYIIKHSRFIGYAKHTESEREALDFIAEIRKKHWDATHNVYAYSLREGFIKRYSDDGEPQGTAGMPVLNVLQMEDITDCAVVVTRYFGGILLGAGGLVRAYSHTAKLGINAAGIAEIVLFKQYKLKTDYSYYSKIQTLISDCGGVIEKTDFAESIIIEYRLIGSAEEIFLKKLSDISNGRIIPENIGEVYAPRGID